MNHIAKCTLAVTLLLSAGCGFHLRGQNTIAPQLLCLKLASITPYGDFETTLRNTLQRIGVNVTRTGDAPATLHIISISLYNDVPTIGGSNQARVYVYYYRVNFEVYDGAHRLLIQPQCVTTSKTLIVNAGTALESTGQLPLLTHEMQVETSHMILNILNSISIAG